MNKEAPKIIYLQWGDYEDITWCEDQIGEEDVAYVRADLHYEQMLNLLAASVDDDIE